MKNDKYFDIVMDRLKDALNTKTYSGVAKALGMSSSAFANRKKAESLPFEKIIPLATSRRVSLEWLFVGQGDKFQKIYERPPEEVKPEVFALIVRKLEKRVWERTVKSSDFHDNLLAFLESSWQIIKKGINNDRSISEWNDVINKFYRYAHEQALLASFIYNAVRNIKDTDKLNDEIERKITDNLLMFDLVKKMEPEKQIKEDETEGKSAKRKVKKKVIKKGKRSK